MPYQENRDNRGIIMVNILGQQCNDSCGIFDWKIDIANLWKREWINMIDGYPDMSSCSG